MDFQNIPRDDLLDVMEMTKKLEGSIYRILKDNEVNLGMSALMSATINTVLSQCKTIQEIQMYRNIFIQIFDSAILNVKIKDSN